MKHIGYLFILLLLVFSCDKGLNNRKLAHEFMPANAEIIFKINELNDFVSNLENHDILSPIYNKDLEPARFLLKYINPTEPVYLVLTKSENGSRPYLLITKNSPNVFVLDSLKQNASQELKGLIKQTTIDSTSMYHRVSGPFFLASDSEALLMATDKTPGAYATSKLLETTNEKKVASVVFSSAHSKSSHILFDAFGFIPEHKAYSALDIEYTTSSLNYNGIIKAVDSMSSPMDCFKNTVPQTTSALAIAPDDTKSIMSLTYDDFSVFDANRKAFIQQKDSTSTQAFLKFTNEAAVVDDVLVFHTLDPNLVLEAIEEKNELETFRDITLFEFKTPDIFESNLLPFIRFQNANYLTIYNNFILFSSSISALKTIITKQLNNSSLLNSDAFGNIAKALSDEASLFIFKNSEGLSEVLNKDLKAYDANAVQFIYEDQYAHVNGIIQQYKKRARSNSISEAFEIGVDAPIILGPQTVGNHITGAHDIVVQDAKNSLYLISSSGKVLWKKQLRDKVLGDIEQIDIYKNGRLQLAFATSNRLYVLDRNGKEVGPFPLKFKDPITQPLAVFDYDNDKNYRLLVTQGKALLMYDVKGTAVSGFNYQNDAERISSQPKHFRIGTKDYIAFKTPSHLRILNRQGKPRIAVDQNIRFSDNDLYLYQNQFTSTNTLGQLVQVDTKGRLTTKDLNLPASHRIATTSKTLAYMTENTLTIKSRSVNLDFGDYTPPKIFYLNDKIYITTTDLQSKKVYLFDSQAEPIPNFPVFGTSAALLEKLDKDKGLELITQSDDAHLVAYKLH